MVNASKASLLQISQDRPSHMVQENNEQSKNQLDVCFCLALWLHLEDPNRGSNIRRGQRKMSSCVSLAQHLHPTRYRHNRDSSGVFYTSWTIDLLLCQDSDGSDAKEYW